jgi:hypothetical protein
MFNAIEGIKPILLKIHCHLWHILKHMFGGHFESHFKAPQRQIYGWGQNTLKGAKKVLDVKNYHGKFKIYLFIPFWNYGNYGKLFLYNTNDC